VPIHIYSLEVGQPAERKPTSKARLGSAPIAAAIATLLLLVAASGWYMLNGRVMEPTQAAHLSIVALPFVNLSGDPSPDYFADGVSENLTTELSRIKDSFVIARDTAFTYRGKSVGAKEVGKELGVRYVLEGSVQRDQNRVRVNAQLIDAESGGLLWADRFEEDMADLFKLQDEVVARLASSFGYALTYAEGKKSNRSKNPDAIDLAMQGWALIYGSFQQPWKEMRERVNAARALFDQALKIAPNDADALAGSAATYLRDFTFEFSDAQTDYEAKVLGQASRAIGLAPDNPRPYAIDHCEAVMPSR
jgi:TolB-like protein